MEAKRISELNHQAVDLTHWELQKGRRTKESEDNLGNLWSNLRTNIHVTGLPEANFAKCSVSWLGSWLLSRGGRLVHQGETTWEEGALPWGWPPWGRCEVQRALQSCPIKGQGHLVMGCPMGWCWGRHQACCHLLALVNNTAMNTEYISNSLGYIPRQNYWIIW